MEVKRYFELRADRFDALYGDADGWPHWLNRLLRRGLYERVRLTLAELEDLTGRTVLDVGCGSGRNSVLFAEAGARRVVGIDFSERMIELAVAFSRNRGAASRCEFIKADFLECSFEEKFDVVVALGVFDYVADPKAFLRRMIETAALAVIASFPRWTLVRAPLRKVRYGLRNCPVYFFDQEGLEALCREVGLRQYRLVPYASGGVLLVGKVDPH